MDNMTLKTDLICVIQIRVVCLLAASFFHRELFLGSGRIDISAGIINKMTD